jgi:dTDP-glucose 4,6-dehydratase
LLITGGAGFIGSNFVRYWLHQHADDCVVVVDSLTYAGNVANLPAARDRGRCRLVCADICDMECMCDLLLEEKIDCVVHFAAESHVDRSIAGPDEFIRTNVLGTHALLKAARSVWSTGGRLKDAFRFQHVSTDEVYGTLSATDPAFTEASAYAPNSPYSASKAASDHLARAYHHTYGLPVTTSNCSNNYGPYQFPEKLIPLMLVHALDGKEMPVYGSGENVRDWLYVEDHCRAVEAVLLRGRVGQTYNVGGCEERRNIDIVHLLCACLERRFARQPELAARFPDCPAAAGRPIGELIRFVQDRPGHDWRYAIDSAKIREELGFIALERFDSGIEKTVDWYLENEDWWRAVLSGEYRRHTARPALDARSKR